MKNRRLRSWVKISIFLIILAFLVYALIGLIGVQRTYTSPTGRYTCKGTILKICSGNKEVYNYFK